MRIVKNYPVFISLQGKPVSIAGGGENALRKARLLIAAGAKVTLIAPEIAEAVRQELGDRVCYALRAPQASDFTMGSLAIIAEEAPSTQKDLHALAKSKGALVNVVDAPALCDFTTPSIIDRGDVVVAISTNGMAPVYGRTLRARIEALLPARLGELIGFAGAYRPAVKSRYGEKTRHFWERFFRGPVAQRVLLGDEAGAHDAMLKTLNRPTPVSEAPVSEAPVSDKGSSIGSVHIVGAGPGDPELLTLRAHRILQDADVILYDRLVSDDILTLARRDAERVFVGKAKSNHAVPQTDIQARMIALAQDGKTVVRLKGGDPFIFGRGGEELDALRAANIPTFVTPGITAATGCAASAGMALTHRDHAQAVTFVTGHAKEDSEPDLDWQALADLKHTLVVYMGVSASNMIAENLINHGRDPSTPITVIENGTRADEIVAQGTLITLASTIERSGIKGPAILVIGDVAALAKAPEAPAPFYTTEERLSA